MNEEKKHHYGLQIFCIILVFLGISGGAIYYVINENNNYYNNIISNNVTVEDDNLKGDENTYCSGIYYSSDEEKSIRLTLNKDLTYIIEEKDEKTEGMFSIEDGLIFFKPYSSSETDKLYNHPISDDCIHIIYQTDDIIIDLYKK